MSNSTNRHREKVLHDTVFDCYRTCVTYDTVHEDIDDVTSTAFKGQSSLHATKSMDDVVTERFKSRSAKGEIINNPMYSEVFETFDSVACVNTNNATYVPEHIPPTEGCNYGLQGTRYFGNYSASYVGCQDPNYLVTSLDDSLVDVEHLKQLAVTDAYANIDFSDASLTETVGELDETIEFLKSTLYRGAKLFRAVRKCDLKYLRKNISFKELSDRYMEIRYGLRPLIYDMRNIEKTLRFSKFADRYTFRGFQTDTVSIEQTRNQTLWTNYDATYVTTIKQKVDVRAGVLVSLDAEHPPDIWGVDQPIEAIWELVPFSFIADWFFNIGSTIASWTPNVGSKELAAWCTVNEELYCEDRLTNIVSNRSSYESNYKIYNYIDSVSVNNAYTYTKKVKKQRIVNPTRSFIPTYNVNLNALKLLDLAIICKNALGGSYRHK